MAGSVGELVEVLGVEVDDRVEDLSQEWHPVSLGDVSGRHEIASRRGVAPLGPPADRKYNRAFSRRRIVVEHAIGRLRRFRAVAPRMGKDVGASSLLAPRERRSIGIPAWAN